MRAAGAFAGVAALTAVSGAVAQTVLPTDVPGPPFAGARWAVAAPQGASWALDCRFVPVTYPESQYDLHYWANRMRRQGSGADHGRLPGRDGRCILTKTGGAGPVGLGLANPGSKAASAGTNDPARPAYVMIF
ncbi:hypothetical protein BH09PSE1_BH09PSE1_22280 [soil metagenome]